MILAKCGLEKGKFFNKITRGKEALVEGIVCHFDR